MSALYATRFSGGADAGVGALYIGKGIILGIDVGGVHYNGTYTENGSRIKGKGILSAPQGATLVTGLKLPPGMKIEIEADWPANFANGQPQTIMVQKHPVKVTLQKIGDVP